MRTFKIYKLCVSPVSLQSPPSMKAVLQAGWLMTVAFGNLIVVIIAGADTISDQVNVAEKLH